MLFNTNRSISILRVLDFSEFKQILNSYFFFQIRNVILKIRHVFIKFTLKELDKGDLLSFFAHYDFSSLWLYVTVQNFCDNRLFFWTIYKRLVNSKYFLVFTTTMIWVEMLKDKTNKTEVSKTADRSTFKKKWYVNQ